MSCSSRKQNSQPGSQFDPKHQLFIATKKKKLATKKEERKKVVTKPTQVDMARGRPDHPLPPDPQCEESPLGLSQLLHTDHCRDRPGGSRFPCCVFHICSFDIFVMKHKYNYKYKYKIMKLRAPALQARKDLTSWNLLGS